MFGKHALHKNKNFRDKFFYTQDEAAKFFV